MLRRLHRHKAAGKVPYLRPTLHILFFLNLLAAGAASALQTGDITKNLSLKGDLLSLRLSADSDEQSLASEQIFLEANPALAPMLNLKFRLDLLNQGPSPQNAGSDQPGGISLTNAFVEKTWDAGKSSFKYIIGHSFVPIGQENITNDPFVRWKTQATGIEGEILPVNWHEHGTSIEWKYGERFSALLGVYTSLDATLYREEAFLPSGVQNGRDVKITDTMEVLRVGYAAGSSAVTASFAYGEAAQDSAFDKMAFNLWHLFAKTEVRDQNSSLEGFGVQGLVGGGLRSQTFDLTGFHAESAIGYSLLLFKKMLILPLNLFYEFETYDLNASVLSTQTRLERLDKVRQTLGLNYRWHQQLQMKVDYAFRSNAAKDEDDLTSLQLMFQF